MFKDPKHILTTLKLISTHPALLLKKYTFSSLTETAFFRLKNVRMYLRLLYFSITQFKQISQKQSQHVFHSSGSCKICGNSYGLM